MKKIITIKYSVTERNSLKLAPDKDIKEVINMKFTFDPLFNEADTLPEVSIETINE